ncbi:MAG: hypothetical protein GX885_03655 [Methanomicrobiales archaeon]|nr:hypothetical protein [Methanomicrobiales archaeon]
MVLESLKDALGLLRHPVIWSVGLVMGAALFATTIATTSGGGFYAEPLALLLFLVVPFLAGGIYGTVRDEEFSVDVFVQSGKTYYFRILLPALLIFFATFLTALLLAVPLTLIGGGIAAGAAPLLFGVLVSIVFFTFFYDTVAVFEETNVFESIRRSIEFVMNNLGRTTLFYLANIIVLVVLWFAGSFVWTTLLMDKLEPLIGMDPSEIQGLMPQDILALIGTEGIWIVAGVTAVVVVLFSAFLYAYKVSFFRNRAVGARTLQGEYDEKGRWYKY